MKKLNKNATAIFCQLIEAMGRKPHMKIFNEPFMPLTVEKVGEQISTPWGIGSLYSLCHYYEQNGDLMQDPEIGFVVVDNRDAGDASTDLVGIYPYMYQKADLCIYQESILIESDKLTRYSKKWQADHAAFANQWLDNIRAQEFLKQLLDTDKVQFSD